MDMETVLPFKTVNDIVKEIKESDELTLVEEKQCSCGHCSCGGDV
jgi:DNA polymerase III sliding clamp (beta) subunit (PCNA family)